MRSTTPKTMPVSGCAFPHTAAYKNQLGNALKFQLQPLCLCYLNQRPPADTVYFNESCDAARKAVSDTLDAFQALLGRLRWVQGAGVFFVFCLRSRRSTAPLMCDPGAAAKDGCVQYHLAAPGHLAKVQRFLVPSGHVGCLRGSCASSQSRSYTHYYHLLEAFAMLHWAWRHQLGATSCHMHAPRREGCSRMY